MPTDAIARPINRLTKLFGTVPCPVRTAQVRPRQASQKLSKLLKLIAIRASCGAISMRMMTPITPPMLAVVRDTNSDVFACPRLDRRYASSI